jgi:predicted chitinase
MTVKEGQQNQPKASTGGVIGVCKDDIGTKDDWIHRDPALIRLTGRHPFNWYVVVIMDLHASDLELIQST